MLPVLAFGEAGHSARASKYPNSPRVYTFMHALPSTLTAYLMPPEGTKLSRSALQEYIKDIESASLVASNQDEVHACCVRIWLLYKQVEETHEWCGSFGIFCKTVKESRTAMASYLLGLHKHPKYSASIPHRWASSLTRRWLKRGGPEVVIIMYPNGTLLPITWAPPKY